VGKNPPKGIFDKLTTQMNAFNKDLKDIYDKNDAMKKGYIIATYKDMCHNVHIHHLGYDGKNELLVIKNFGHGFHLQKYGYEGFPSGKWQEIFNSDAVEYGGSGFINIKRTYIDKDNQSLSLAPNSFMILKKVSD
jgi:1,4-alpha-glucan branching enzyme